MTAPHDSGRGTASIPPRRDPVWDTLNEVVTFLTSLRDSREFPQALKGDLNKLITVGNGVLNQNGEESLQVPEAYTVAWEVYQQCKGIDVVRHSGRGWIELNEFPADPLTLVQGDGIFWQYQKVTGQIYLSGHRKVAAWARKQGGER